MIVGLHYFSIVDCMRKGSQLAIFAKKGVEVGLLATMVDSAVIG